MRKNIEISDKKISEFLEQFYGYFASGYLLQLQIIQKRQKNL